MKKILLLMLSLSLILCSCSGVNKKEYDDITKKLEEANSKIEELNSSLSSKTSDYDAMVKDRDLSEAKYNTKNDEYNELKSEYDTYKEKMKPYEKLSEAEAKARQIEAEKVAKEKEEKEKEAAEKAAKEAEKKERAGYNTGITYKQLARTPDDYISEKVKFKGEVVQVMEGDGEVQIRLAVDKDYDKIILCVYNSNIVSSRVLEDDVITIYGTSAGLYTYESTLGGNITIPSVLVDKIDQ